MSRYLILLYLFFFLISVSGYTQKREKIVETVDVIHIEVPLRVFYRGETVGGLTKEDFQLFENRKQVEILGFNQYSKKIKLKTREAISAAPRLFVLIFNISDYNNYLAEEINSFFERILRTGDRLAIMTNHFNLGDHTVSDIDRERDRLTSILSIESRRIRKEIFFMESRLESIYATYQFLADNPESRVHGIKLFFTNYLEYLDTFRQAYFELDNHQLVEMAEYMEGQNLDKWVINFFQIGMFHEPPKLLDIIREWDFDPGNPYGGLYLEVIQKIQGVGDISTTRNLARLFINSGVTFHTLLLRSRSFRSLHRDFDYRPIGMPSENMLREITRMTGGKTGSMKVTQFIDKIVEKEDIYYRLTYLSDNNSKAKSKISVKVKRPRHRVIFDNQRRPQIQQAQKIEQRQVNQQQFKLSEVTVVDQKLHFWISGIVIKQDALDKRGEVEFRIQIIDANTKIKFQRRRLAPVSVSNFEMRIDLRKAALPSGTYTLILEAIDQIGKRSDLALIDFDIKIP